MNVVVYGLGYVGTVTAACLAANGHEVSGVDPQPAKVDAIARGRSPVVEPGLDDLVAEGARRGALKATTDSVLASERADVSIICVGTPSTPSGSTDLSYVLRAVEDVAHALLAREGLAREGTAPTFHSVMIRSTVPPGTVDECIIPALEAALGRRAGTDFGVAMCPEFLREGSGIADFFDPPFTVVGTAHPQVAEAVGRLLGFLTCPLRLVSVRTAEGLKYACNAFHAMKVSFANELARLYRPLGVDARDVMELFCEDHSLNISPRYLRPGFAFGGSCLPKDLRSLLYLGRMNSVDTPLLSGTLLSNDVTVREVAQRTMTDGGRTVALLGLSFKMETDDLRESPSVELAEILLGKGFDVRIFDPVIQPSRLVGTNLSYVESKLPHLRGLLADSPEEALDGADVALVSSNAAPVVNALVANPPKTIIDLDGRLGAEVQALAGYQGVGW
ncbi:MAG: GDP-mannose 6-dehydrogenase [Actinomycetota bacterium]|jgi:GDP-mannose 6-dehydrogenase|nr:GDP-mannose 6-dehydrogenase [Actinomycetota bacterium]